MGDSPRRHRFGLTLMLIACPLRSADQLRHWRNSETLFSHALEVTEHNYLAHDNLGVALAERGVLDRAQIHFEAALRVKPNHASAY